DRCEVVSEMGLSFDRRRHELNRRLPHCAPLGRFHYRKSAYQLRIRSVSALRRWTGTAHGRHRRHADLLAHALLDVPQASLPSDLNLPNKKGVAGFRHEG